jgi:predicted Zn-dependent peptidase
MQLVFEDSGALSDQSPGQAKMAARLLGEGTRKDGAVGFARRLESKAISLSTHAGRETMVVELSSLREAFDDGIGMLAELLKDPNYSYEAFETVQNNILGKLTQKQSDFDYQASVALSKALFSSTPLADPADGSIDSIKKMDYEDLSYHIITHLGLSNLTVVIGGDMEWSDAEAYIQKALFPLKQNSVVPVGHFTTTSQPKTARQSMETEQAYVYFGAPLDVAYDGDETHLAKVAAFVLGSSGFGSRLMEEVRVKRGLAYSAYGRFVLNRSASYFTGHLQTKLESETEAVEVVKVVVNEFVANGITEKELEGAKLFLLGSEPLRNETLSQRIGRAFNEYYAHKPLGSNTEELKKIESLTLDEVNGFIKKHEEITQLSFSIIANDM